MKIIFLFPGFGSQYVGMGKELYDEFRIVQEYFEEASNCLNINFVKLCFASSDAELSKLPHAYPAIFLVSSSIVALLKELGISPTELCGYNQGEFAALFASGSISFPDGLYLLNKFAQFYEQSLEEMHVAIIKVTGVDAKEIEDICLKVNKQSDAKAFVSIYQSPTTQIVGGDAQAIYTVKELINAETKGIVDDISLHGGLHSPLMTPILEKFKIYLEKVDFKDAQVPLIEGIDGTRMQKDTALKELVIKSIHSPIMWTKVVKELAAFDLIVEIGPGTTLSSLARQEYPDKQILAVNTKEDVRTLQTVLGVPSAEPEVQEE